MTQAMPYIVHSLNNWNFEQLEELCQNNPGIEYRYDWTREIGTDVWYPVFLGMSVRIKLKRYPENADLEI